MAKEITEERFIPFGKEWEKEVMKMTKAELIRFYKDRCIEFKELQIMCAERHNYSLKEIHKRNDQLQKMGHELHELKLKSTKSDAVLKIGRFEVFEMKEDMFKGKPTIFLRTETGEGTGIDLEKLFEREM